MADLYRFQRGKSTMRHENHSRMWIATYPHDPRFESNSTHVGCLNDTVVLHLRRVFQRCLCPKRFRSLGWKNKLALPL